MQANQFHFVSVMSHLAREGRWEEVLEMMAEMDRIGMAPDQVGQRVGFNQHCEMGWWWVVMGEINGGVFV
jgi:pentatricopeptide repeat protein